MEKYFISLYKNQGIGDNNNRGKKNCTTEATMTNPAKEAASEAVAERRTICENIGQFDMVVRSRFIDQAIESGCDPVAAFWALRRMAGSDEGKYQPAVCLACQGTGIFQGIDTIPTTCCECDGTGSASERNEARQ
jgi:hypothetical protein